MTRQTNVFKVKRQAFALVLFLVLATSPALSQTVILGWDSSPDTSAAGYNIYYGTASHVYTTKVSVGNVTNATIYGLTGGQTYFFAATTYDTSNQESGFSNEASYAVPLNVTNAQPTLAALSNLVINENAPAQSILLTGISSGATNENQTLTVTASSSNLALIPNPTVTYTSPNTTGSIAFTPVSNAFGAATVSVTVNDGGTSNNIITRTFNVTVNHVNQPPTLNVLSDVVISENAPVQTIALTGISSGAANENQTLTVTASSSTPGLILNPTVTYSSPNSSGSITFTPVAKNFGAAVISVTVNDGGTSNNIITRTFNVTVNNANQQPTLNVLGNVVISENAPVQTINLTGISSGATNENQTLTVTASSSSLTLIPNPTVTYTSPNTTGSISFTPVSDAFGAATISVTVNDGGTSNNIITRTFNVAVNHVNQPPTLNALSNVVINENASVQTIALTGISSGATNENQTLTVTASSSKPGLIPNPIVSYSSPNTTGSLTFMPTTNAFGWATISVTVNDGGTSNNIITRHFSVTVLTSDLTTPTLSIVSPGANARSKGGTCAVNGKANDNVAISQLLYSLNGAPWTSAVTFNNWKDWTCSLSLKPGNNTLRAYAVDTSGNVSPTSTVTFSYDLLMPLSVQIFGLGTSNPRWGSIRPNISGRMLLPVNENSTLTAKASPGFAFANWTDGLGNLLTNSATLQFTMATNLALRANFVDVTRPTLSIMTPSANQQVTNGAFTVAGLAGDNVAVSTVYFSLNGSGWTPAGTGNNWRNWTASLALAPGTNNVRAYAVDTSGNFSTVNSVEFKYMITGQLSAARAVQQTAPAALARVVAPAKGQFALTVSGTAGYDYVVQVSSDLMNWTSVLTNKAPFMFVDTNASRFQQRFYRSFYQP